MKGPHIVAPHHLPAELLLRMRRENRAAALAFMDQSQILRSVFSSIVQSLLVAASGCNDRCVARWRVDRTRLPARTTATRDRASRAVVVAANRRPNACTNDRTDLHLRRTN